MPPESATPASAGLLQVTVPLTPAYASESVTIEQTTTTLTIPLIPGEQRSTTPEQVVGSLSDAANPNLVGTLTVWSSYDPTYHVLTLLGSEFESEDSTYLSTYPQSGRDRTFKQQARPSDAGPGDTSSLWASAADSTAEMAELFQSTVRSANEAIVEAAVAQGISVIVRTPPPELPPELEEKLLLVYENGVFKEPYDPDKEYGEDTQVFNIQSTFGGTMVLAAGTDFANVIGSTYDPKIEGRAWRELWEVTFHVEGNRCASEGFQGFECSTTYIGGHVIPGKVASEVAQGSNIVFIIPICQRHNKSNSVYMNPIVYNQAVSLHHYME